MRFLPFTYGARGDAVGWGTALQAGRSRVRFLMVSLDFFIDIILPAALWPWGWLSLYQKWVPGMFPGGKGGWCVGLTTLPPSCANCLEIWDPHPPGTLRVCPGLWWDCFTFYHSHIVLIKRLMMIRVRDRDMWLNNWDRIKVVFRLNRCLYWMRVYLLLQKK